jgi:TonB family protein
MVAAVPQFHPPDGLRRSRADDAIGLLLGIGTTLGLFLAIAHFERGRSPAPPLEDLVEVSTMEAPPPPPVEQPDTQPALADDPGIAVEASDSPVRIAVAPPDPDALFPTTPLAPPAVIQIGILDKHFNPRLDIGSGVRRVYQQNEVDRRVTALVRAVPQIPPRVRGDAESLRVLLIFIVTGEGRAIDLRVAKTSGNPKFDRLVEDCVRDEWTFTTPTKNGRKVDCLVQQSFTVTLRVSTSPFEL